MRSGPATTHAKAPPEEAADQNTDEEAPPSEKADDPTHDQADGDRHRHEAAAHDEPDQAPDGAHDGQPEHNIETTCAAAWFRLS